MHGRCFYWAHMRWADRDRKVRFMGKRKGGDVIFSSVLALCGWWLD